MRFRFYYSGIRVRDLDRSLRFYTQAMGMKIVRRGKMKHGGIWVQLTGGRGRGRPWS
jgi:catechol 2,3-dioxygenase-like lactoylglutathione lyase family enzyme